MYTVKSYTDEIQKEIRSRVVTVTYTDNGVDLIQAFRFSIGTEDVKVKRAVVDFLNELNFVFTPVTGDITTLPAEPTPTEPTAKQLARTAYDSDRNKLKTLMDLVRDGVFTGDEAEITALQAKVKADFKPAYLG